MWAWIDTVISLKHYSITDIDQMTKDSAGHNADKIWSGQFAQRCQGFNQNVAKQILKQFS
jgi:hypothetical protein